MNSRSVVIGAGVVCMAAMAPALQRDRGTVRPRAVAVPQMFETNAGQADPEFSFVSRLDGSLLLLSPTRVVVPQFSIQLQGANPSATGVGLNRLPGAVHYLHGSRPALWRRDIVAYGRVLFKGVYPGVDLLYHWSGGRLEYDFVVSPQAEPAAIELTFDGVEQLQIDRRGGLELHTRSGAVAHFLAPVVYQERDGRRASVAGAYALGRGNRVTFSIGAYERTRPLIIDPVFGFSTRLGGQSGDGGYAVAVDRAGNVYVTGDAASVDFPRKHAMQRKLGGSTDVFVTKLTPSGELVYSTFIGGSEADVGYGIAVDASGNAYVTGDTRSRDYPLVGQIQEALGGVSDVFVSKISADGSRLVYSTYVGGSEGERGFGIAVDTAGAAYVAGYTNSRNFPTVKPIQAAFGGGDADAFVFKLAPGGAALAYSTYLGGRAVRPELATSIAVDLTGSAYVTGFTNSVDFPTAKPIQPFRGPTDAFITKVSPNGAHLVYSTHLGGRADDEGQGIAVDSAGNAYVAGHTESPDFPTTRGAYSTKCTTVPVAIAIGDICSGGDVFITKITADGSSMGYSTYVNGRRFESARGIAVDATGRAFVTGFTGSSDFTTVTPAQRTFGGGNLDGFVLKVNREGSALVYATYLGGAGEDGGYGIAVDRRGSAYVTGVTGSSDFPARAGAPSRPGPAPDAFITVLPP